MRRTAAVLMILSLAACGVRGSLQMPSGPAPEPLLGHAGAPAKPAALDVSTPTRPQDQ